MYNKMTAKKTMVCQTRQQVSVVFKVTASFIFQNYQQQSLWVRIGAIFTQIIFIINRFNYKLSTPFAYRGRAACTTKLFWEPWLCKFCPMKNWQMLQFNLHFNLFIYFYFKDISQYWSEQSFIVTRYDNGCRSDLEMYRFNVSPVDVLLTWSNK